MTKYSYKVVGKPLHPNKHQAIFDLCNAFMNIDGYERVENEDWKILGEQCGFISIMNKHTFEAFEILILNI